MAYKKLSEITGNYHINKISTKYDEYVKRYEKGLTNLVNHIQANSKDLGIEVPEKITGEFLEKVVNSEYCSKEVDNAFYRLAKNCLYRYRAMQDKSNFING